MARRSGACQCDERHSGLLGVAYIERPAGWQPYDLKFADLVSNSEIGVSRWLRTVTNFQASSV